MSRDRFISISRAGGIKLAGPAKKRRKKSLIHVDKQQQNPFPGASHNLYCEWILRGSQLQLRQKNARNVELQLLRTFTSRAIAHVRGSNRSNSLVTTANSAVATDVRG